MGGALTDRLRGWRRLAGAALLALAGCGSAIVVEIPSGLGFGQGSRTPPRGYALLYSPAEWAYRTSVAGEPVRRGSLSERFELRDGDCGGSDCGAFRARAQIVQARDASRARINQDVWFGWSFYNATIPAVSPQTFLGTVVGEWKLRGDRPAPFRFLQVPPREADLARCDPVVCATPGDPTGDVMVELDAMATALGWGEGQNKGRVCRLWNMQDRRGGWVDIVVNTNFGTDAAGYLRVWIDGELRCDYAGPLVPAADGAAGVDVPTHRRGIFNSFMRRWPTGEGAPPKPTLVAFYDEFRTGRARADVDPALRAAAGTLPGN